MTDKDQLTRMQRDILELELRGEKTPGAKISAFRKLYPTVTEMGYYMALLVLIRTPAAYEVDGRRYGEMLRQLDVTSKQRLQRRLGLRAKPDEVQAL